MKKLAVALFMLAAFAAGIVVPAIASAQTADNQITLILQKENPTPVTPVLDTTPVASSTFILPTIAQQVVAPIVTPVTPSAKKISRLDQLVAKLKINTVSNEVAELQTELKKLGYFATNFKPTKKYGPATAAAVKKYNSDKKLPRLEQLVSRLRSGMVSAEVLELQTELKKLGYFSKTFKPTNKYGASTAAAVKKYSADKKKKTVAAKPASSTKTETKPVASTKPVVTVPTAPATPTYTLAQVQTANTATKCWSAIGGKIYDISAYFGGHPGGDSTLKSLCGKDGTTAFNNMHGGKVKPETILKSFQIGLLK